MAIGWNFIKKIGQKDDFILSLIQQYGIISDSDTSIEPHNDESTIDVPSSSSDSIVELHISPAKVTQV